MTRKAHNTKLSAARVEAFLAGLRNGGFRYPAARAAGISPDTLVRWQKRGEKDLRAGRRTLEAKLAEGIPLAEAEAEANALKVIQRAAVTDRQWTAAAWLLERKFPERWALKNRVELTGKDGGPVEVTNPWDSVVKALKEPERDPEAERGGTGPGSA